jgi:hypothetical protein
LNFNCGKLSGVGGGFCFVIVIFVAFLFGCIPKGQFLNFDVSPEIPERAGLIEIKVDQDHQSLDGTKNLSYTIGPYDGLVIDLGSLSNKRFKGVPTKTVEVVTLMDGHRVYIIKIKPNKRRYVLLPHGGIFLERELVIGVGYLDPDSKSLNIYPTWLGHVGVDEKRVK